MKKCMEIVYEEKKGKSRVKVLEISVFIESRKK